MDALAANYDDGCIEDYGTCEYMNYLKIGNITEDSYAFEKPVTLSITQQGMGLIPFMMTADVDKAFLISKDKVITMIEPQEAIRAENVKATTGLITPPCMS